jgi:hypothetical protein
MKRGRVRSLWRGEASLRGPRRRGNSAPGDIDGGDCAQKAGTCIKYRWAGLCSEREHLHQIPMGEKTAHRVGFHTNGRGWC